MRKETFLNETAASFALECLCAPINIAAYLSYLVIPRIIPVPFRVFDSGSDFTDPAVWKWRDRGLSPPSPFLRMMFVTVTMGTLFGTWSRTPLDIICNCQDWWRNEKHVLSLKLINTWISDWSIKKWTLNSETFHFDYFEVKIERSSISIFFTSCKMQ